MSVERREIFGESIPIGPQVEKAFRRLRADVLHTLNIELERIRKDSVAGVKEKGSVEEITKKMEVEIGNFIKCIKKG